VAFGVSGLETEVEGVSVEERGLEAGEGMGSEGGVGSMVCR